MMKNSTCRLHGVFYGLAVCFCALWVALFSPGFANGAEAEEEETFAGETEKGSVLEMVDEAIGYRIGAGDILEIVVWREPDISRTVNVRPDGRVSLPLVDDVPAAGGTLLELKDRLTETLSRFVDEPAVYVMLQENRSKRFHIIGTVRNPGEYIMRSKTSVLQAIAMAGGFTEWAKKGDIAIVRRSSEGQGLLKFDYDGVVSGKKLEQNIFLMAEDVIVVP